MSYEHVRAGDTGSTEEAMGRGKIGRAERDVCRKMNPQKYCL